MKHNKADDTYSVVVQDITFSVSSRIFLGYIVKVAKQRQIDPSKALSFVASAIANKLPPTDYNCAPGDVVYTIKPPEQDHIIYMPCTQHKKCYILMIYQNELMEKLK